MNGKMTQSRRNMLGQMVNRGYIACGEGTGGSRDLAEELVLKGLAERCAEFSGTRYFQITPAGRAALSPHIEQGETKV